MGEATRTPHAAKGTIIRGREGGMKRSRGVWAWLAWALPVGGAVLIGSGCQRNPLDETPPFNKTDASTSLKYLYEAYSTDETEADKLYKGKILFVCDAPALHSLDAVGGGYTPARVDSAGDKYIAAVLADPGAGSGKREVIRCYFYRPDNPLRVGPGSEVYDVIGVCVGKVDGVIVLRKCYYSVSGGPDW
jgi:hypothetical protein